MQAERPLRDADIEFTLVTRGLTIPSQVEQFDESGLVLRPHLAALLHKIAVRPGEVVELYWQGTEDEQTMPARISEVEDAGERLHLTPTGPARRSQRRRAVRAAIELPVLIKIAGIPLFGRTVDLSEAGLRTVVDGWDCPPSPARRSRQTSPSRTPRRRWTCRQSPMRPSSAWRASSFVSGTSVPAGSCPCSSTVCRSRWRIGCAGGCSALCARSAPALSTDQGR